MITKLHALMPIILLCAAIIASPTLASESKKMYVYEMQPKNTQEGYDETLALVCMQGIINRDEPIIYVNNSSYGRPMYWLEIMSKDKRWLDGRERKTITGLDAVRRLAGKKLKGAVIWDPDVPASINVATTISGVEDAVALSPELAEKVLKKWDLPVIKDLRGLFTGKETGSKKNDAYRWAIREYIDKGKCSSHFLCLYTDSFRPRATGDIAYVIVRDWAVTNRAFTFDLSPWGDEVPGDDPTQQLGTDLATYKMVLASTLKQSAGKQMTELAGFFDFGKYSNIPGHESKHDPVPTEWESVYLMSPYNCYQNTATEFCYNQSFHCHAPDVQLKQHRPTVKRKLENKAYFAILMADYDSAFPLYHFMPKHWDDKIRGELPLAWGINPNLLETYPDIISYFYQTASSNDYFVSDASAAGYMNPNFVQKQYLPLFVKHNTKFFKQADMTIAGMVLDWDQPRPDVKDAFTKFAPDGFGTIVMDLHGNGGRHPNYHVWKDMPVIQLLNNATDYGDKQKVADVMYFMLRNRTKDQPSFFYFRSVWVSPSDIKEALKLLTEQHPEGNFELVDIYSFFDLFKQHYAGKQ